MELCEFCSDSLSDHNEQATGRGMTEGTKPCESGLQSDN